MTAISPGRPCCRPLDEVVDPTVATVALTGAPNVGKSTLFNALSGARVSVGNWPGTSTEVSRGHWSAVGGGVNLVDLPGAYSLEPMSEDERLTHDLLISADPPEVTVVLVDAANLARGLYLVAEVLEAGLSCVVALTMSDIAARRGLRVDPDRLAAQLGTPVVAVDPRRRTGLDDLAAVVSKQLASDPVPRAVSLPVPVGADLTAEDRRFAWIEEAVEAASTQGAGERTSLSDRLDRWVLGPVSGILIFLAAMWVVFQLTTAVAAPLQDGLDAFFAGPVTTGTEWLIDQVGLTDTWVHGLLVDGLVAGVGMVLTFAPLMAIMFVLLALLEDSGYLARAAVVTDRLMRRLGLPGQAFLPLVVGFGCNVPAIAATRILPDAKQRLLTALLVPFTSCTARLVVYMLLGSIFFGRAAGTVVFAMYLTSIALVMLTGILLRRTLWRTMADRPLVMDLPAYQVPTLRLTAAVAWRRLSGFLRTAGGIIVLVVIVVWVLQSIPMQSGAGVFGEVPIEDSVYAWLAGLITPIFVPAGFGHWTLVSALVVGFVAKEAVVAS